ncbi:MAG: hypothetical protein ACKVP0_20440 [Pirellulaceae bacterium]
MGEERSSSGGGTAMIVVAIIGGILLVVVCGGVLVVGAGALFYVRAEQRILVEEPVATPVQSSLDVKEEVNRVLEPMKLDPNDLTEPTIRKEQLEGGLIPGLKNPEPEGTPPAAALEEKKE